MYFGSAFLNTLNHFKKVRAICHFINETENGPSSGAVTEDSDKKLDNNWTKYSQDSSQRSLQKSTCPSFHLFFLSGKWEKASPGECNFSRTVFGFERSLDFLNTLKIAYPCCFFHNIVPSLVWKWHVLLNQSLHDNWILNLKNGNKCHVLYFLSINKSKWQAPSNITLIAIHVDELWRESLLFVHWSCSQQPHRKYGPSKKKKKKLMSKKIGLWINSYWALTFNHT